MYNPISINGHQIEFCQEAVHVGVIRSEKGKIPHIMNRIAAHRTALGATLSSGVAQRSRANPLIGLQLEKIYGSQVLLSGIATLVLCSFWFGNFIDRQSHKEYSPKYNETASKNSQMCSSFSSRLFAWRGSCQT